MNMQQLIANIPLELKIKPNWVLHRNKIPMRPSFSDNVYIAAQSNNKESWSAFNKVCASIKYYDGIGFMFEPPYIGIDLDDCIENGKPNAFATSIINETSSYTELSPSGTGVHIICKGTLPAPIKTATLEVYQTGRYFTMTGNRLSPHSLLREIKSLDFLYPTGYNKPRTLTERLGSLQEGNRNNTLAGIAGSLRRKGYEAEEIFELLKPKAKEIQIDEKELWTICRSIARYEPASSRTVSESNETAGSSIEEFLKTLETVEWIVPGMISKKSIGFVAGLPETMKTWMLIDLAIECAKEKDGLWLGRFPVNHAKVLFIDQERFKGETQRRFKSILLEKGLNVTAIKDALNVRCGTSTRLDLQRSYELFHKEIAEFKPDLIIIDSFATFHTREENNRKDIQEVLERVKALRNEFGCTFIFIDHEGKGVFNEKEQGQEPSAFKMVGSIAKPAAAEFIFTVRKQDSASSMVYHTKSTLASTVSPFLVKVTDLDEAKSKIRVEAF